MWFYDVLHGWVDRTKFPAVLFSFPCLHFTQHNKWLRFRFVVVYFLVRDFMCFAPCSTFSCFLLYVVLQASKQAKRICVFLWVERFGCFALVDRMKVGDGRWEMRFEMRKMRIPCFCFHGFTRLALCVSGL